jgi:putative transposase
VKFHFIAAHRAEFRVRSLCRVLGVSPSGFYAWVRRPAPRQIARNAALLVYIRAAHAASRRTYGPHAFTASSRRRRSRRAGIASRGSCAARGSSRAPSDASAGPPLRGPSCRRPPIACGATSRPQPPIAAGVSDIPSVRTGQGWLHLAVVLDLYARRIVGWAMAATLDPALAYEALAYEALAMALTERRPAPGLVFHSDRGGPYLSLRVQQLAQRHGLIPSTSRPGRCLDNAVAESFFHTLKTELVYQHHYRTREAARLAIFEYLAAFYHRTRRHSSNGFRSPDEHEAAYAVSSP